MISIRKIFFTFGTSYPINFVSIVAVCGRPDGIRVSCRKDSRIVASTYGKLINGIRKEFHNIYKAIKESDFTLSDHPM